MATQYNNNCRGLRYTCSRMAVDYGAYSGETGQ
jgi:hypothetical protein